MTKKSSKRMTEGKHTPGLWQVYHENGSMGSGGHWGIDAMDRRGARVGVCRVFQNSVVSEAEAQANARLIAAAPELLESLKEIRADIRENVEIRSMSFGALVERMDAAITKAGGKEETK